MPNLEQVESIIDMTKSLGKGFLTSSFTTAGSLVNAVSNVASSGNAIVSSTVTHSISTVKSSILGQAE